MPLLDEVRRFLNAEHLSGCRIHTALSGGADSVSLLHALCLLQEELSLDLRAIHIQHNLRGEESLRDEEFCREFCKALGIPLTVVPCDVRGYAQTHRLSEETAARECRYEAFAAHCDGLVATAHTASDQLETVLFRMARGTGLKGLCGIPPMRENFIRPLLRVTRAEVEAYVRAQGLSYVTDSTNADDAYRRNFLRRHIVPKLKDCNPSVERVCSEMTEALSLDADFLQMQTEAALAQCRQPNGSLKGLAALHPAMQRRCIAELLQAENLATHHNILLVQELLQKGGSAELAFAGIRAHVSHDVLWLEHPMTEIPRKPLQLGENCIFEGVSVAAEVISRADSEKFARIHTMFANFVLDYDIIDKYAELHGRMQGMRIRPKGKKHSISIKKWLNAEVQPAERAHVHYLSDANGLLWVQGIGAADHAAVTARTQHMLLLRIITK